jgi:S1-C subfamily serine protease
MNAIRSLLFVLTLGFCGNAAFASSSKNLYQNTVKATVYIQTSTGSGTGWVVDKDKKLIITADHVVNGAKPQVDLFFPKFDGKKVVTDRSKYSMGNRIKGKVIKSDKVRDLALIEAEELPEFSVQLKIADELPESGDDVHTVGCPGASTGFWVYSYGRVRQVTMDVCNGNKPSEKVQVVESQVPINPGDSGGPMVNDAGDLVGVNSSKVRNGSLVSISISCLEVKAFLKEERKERKDLKIGDILAKPTSPQTLEDGESIEARRMNSRKASK